MDSCWGSALLARPKLLSGHIELYYSSPRDTGWWKQGDLCRPYTGISKRTITFILKSKKRVQLTWIWIKLGNILPGLLMWVIPTNETEECRSDPAIFAQVSSAQTSSPAGFRVRHNMYSLVLMRWLHIWGPIFRWRWVRLCSMCRLKQYSSGKRQWRHQNENCNQKRTTYQQVASYDQGQNIASFLAKDETSMPHSGYCHLPWDVFQKTLSQLVVLWGCRGDYIWVSTELNSCYSHTGILCHLGCHRGWPPVATSERSRCGKSGQPYI